MNRYVRYGLVGAGLLALWFTAGYYFQWTWATALWPWPDSRLSYIFIGSIGAAIALPIIWIGLSGEAGAMVGGGLNLGVMSAGIAFFLFQPYWQRGEQTLLILAVGFLLFAVL